MTNVEDLRNALAEDDGSLPERWNADDEPGTTLIGTLLRFETIETDYGEARIAVIKDDDDGIEWGVALFRSVLKNRFEKLAPQIGDTLGLKYVGLVQPRNKGANPYHNYVVRLMRNSELASSVAAPAAADDDEIPF